MAASSRLERAAFRSRASAAEKGRGSSGLFGLAAERTIEVVMRKGLSSKK